MNTNIRSLMILLLLAGFLGSDVFAQPGGRGRGWQYGRKGQSAASQQPSGSSQNERATAQVGSLSEKQRSELILLREEEKLARDVYLAMHERWGSQVFSNIAQAESRHMAAVQRLLGKYQITDPVTDDTPGVFTAPKFQQLYKSLNQSGSQSLIDAIKVGLNIEEMDIVDLRRIIQATGSDDIRRVLQNLESASRNHLRAFSAQLKSFGGTYVATQLSQDEFDAIARSSMERGGNDRQKGFRNGPGGQRNVRQDRGNGRK